MVVTSIHSRLDGSFRYGVPAKQSIFIERGGWVGSRVTITAGSTIGNGALIASGAVIRGEISSNVLAGGMPARVIKDINESQLAAERNSG